MEQIAARLRAHGVRLTRQRRLIVAAVAAQHGHFSVDHIAAVVARRDPAIDLATVYRTLHRLVEIGVLRPLEGGPDRLQFEVAGAQPHHHLICRVCGAQQEIDAELGQVLRSFVHERYNFAAEPEHIALTGRCVQCHDATGEQAL